MTPENVICPLCENADPARFEFVTDTFRYPVRKVAHRCASCGLVFVVPRMTAEEERIFYEKEYGVIFSQEKGTTPRDLFDKRLPEARREAALCRPSLGPDDVCLEVGCASGYFLHTIRPWVRSVLGVETHAELRAYCGEIGLTAHASLDEVPAASVDRIFLFFVLEHVGDPLGFLGRLRGLLREGGRLFVEVPNVDDALLSLYPLPAFKDFYFTPAHQYYYSRATLGRLLEKAGFSRVAIQPEQRYDLSNHMHWMIAGKPGGHGRFDEVFTEELRAAYAETLKARFLCDTLFAVVER
jgi:SAM-dependent methyltransferase